jgi:hypothetical protein
MGDKPEGPDKPGLPDMVDEAQAMVEEIKGKLAEATTAAAKIRADPQYADQDVSRAELGQLKPLNPRRGPKL